MPIWLTIILALGGSSLIGLVVADIYKAIKSKSKKHLETIKKEKQEEMREVLKTEKGSQDMLVDAFEGIGYGIKKN